MSNHLGDGLRAKYVFWLKSASKLLIIFYDTVMNYGDFFSAVKLGMGIGRGNTAMSSSADMAYTDTPREFSDAVLLLYLDQVTYIVPGPYLAIRNCSYTG